MQLFFCESHTLFLNAFLFAWQKKTLSCNGGKAEKIAISLTIGIKLWSEKINKLPFWGYIEV